MYDNTDGSKTAQFSTDPLNVQKSDGSWTPVNTAVKKDSSGSYSVTDHPLSPKFAGKSGAPSADYQVSSAGHTVSFSLEGEKPKTAGRATAVQRRISGGSSGSSIAYAGVESGVDLAYEVTAGQVKETLILNHAPSSAAPSWSWDVHAPGLSLTTSSATSISPTVPGTWCS